MQMDLFEFKGVNSFGGELLNGRRKCARPLATKAPVHLVLRAKQSTLRRHQRAVESELSRFARRFGVTIYRQAVCTNHIHLVIRLHSRLLYRQFVRAFCGSLGLKLNITWLLRPFTRILKWGRDFQTACLYVLQNFMEANGERAYKPRVKKSGRRTKGTGRTGHCRPSAVYEDTIAHV